MRILSIAAPCDGSGKTTLARSILAAFPGRLTYVSFATLPAGAREDPGIGPLPGPAPEGAVRALRCACAPEDYPRTCAALRERHAAADDALLTEGNAAAGILCPDLLIFVWNPFTQRESWEDSGWRLLAGADAVVVNPVRPGRGFDPDGAHTGLLDKTGRTPPGVLRVTADVSRPLPEWADDALLRRLRAALG